MRPASLIRYKVPFVRSPPGSPARISSGVTAYPASSSFQRNTRAARRSGSAMRQTPPGARTVSSSPTSGSTSRSSYIRSEPITTGKRPTPSGARKSSGRVRKPAEKPLSRAFRSAKARAVSSTSVNVTSSPRARHAVPASPSPHPTSSTRTGCGYASHFSRTTTFASIRAAGHSCAQYGTYSSAA